MPYDFDAEVSHRGINSVKWEFVPWGGGGAQLTQTDRFLGANRKLPMWVADMDFSCAQSIVDALIARAQSGIYGYSAPTNAYYDAVVAWMLRRHGWRIEREWICTSPGVVPALDMLIRTFVDAGHRALIQPPVYYPFFSVAANNGHSPVTSALQYDGALYAMDFADLEEKAADPNVTMAILCNPHNPVGRVWTREELQRFGEICLKNDLLVVSDEIHADLIYSGSDFTPYASLGESFAGNAIVCTSASKSFNLAGLQLSNIIIPNQQLRLRFQRMLRNNGMFLANAFGLVAVEAAYNHGEAWLSQVWSYIQENLRFLQTYIARHVPRIEVVRPEATYLVWLDCRRLGLGPQQLQQLLRDVAGVYLDEGSMFGSGGRGFARINIACRRVLLAEALARISDAVAGLDP